MKEENKNETLVNEELNNRIELLFGKDIEGKKNNQKFYRTEEEQKRFKKQLLIVMWIIGISIIGLCMTMFLPFDIASPNEEVNNFDVQQLLPDGDISITNDVIKKINKEFDFDVNNPLYEENILKIYSDVQKNIVDFDFQTKMLLLTSNEKFQTFMETKKIHEYEEKEVKLTVEELEEISKSIFGKDIELKYEDFKYFIKNGDDVVYFDVIFDNGSFIFKQSTGKKSSLMVYNSLHYAYKIGGTIYIQNKLLFVNEKGVYTDKDMTTLLTNDVENVHKFIDLATTTSQFYYGIKTGGKIEYHLNGVETFKN